MKQPFIKINENNNEDIVITYIGDAECGDTIEPQVMIIDPDDAHQILNILSDFILED